MQGQGEELMRLVHGAVIYDVNQQNVCLTDSLMIDQQKEEIRQLIFFPDGRLVYDWVFAGARIL